MEAKTMKGVILDQATFGEEGIDWDAILSLEVDWQLFKYTSEAEVDARVYQADIVLTNKVVLDKQLISRHKQLKYIGVMATGTNNVDVEFAKQQGITVNNVEAYGTSSVVQHTLMLMLNLTTGFSQYQQQIRDGEWQQASSFCLLDHPIHELAGKHLVIVGYGELGRGVEKIARAFDMKVSIAARPSHPPAKGRQTLEALLPEADFVTLHCVSTAENFQLFNHARFSQMKQGAYFINTARGNLVDNNALLFALTSGHLGGAAIDVLDQEPPPANHPLMSVSGLNLIITPHNAWGSIEARQRLLSIAAVKLKEYLKTNF